MWPDLLTEWLEDGARRMHLSACDFDAGTVFQRMSAIRILPSGTVAATNPRADDTLSRHACMTGVRPYSRS